MLCLKCGAKLQVIDSQSSTTKVYRKRRCPDCHRITYTIETETTEDVSGIKFIRNSKQYSRRERR